MALGPPRDEDRKRAGEERALERWRTWLSRRRDYTMPKGWEDSPFAPYWRLGKQIPWTEAEYGMVIDAVRLEGSFPETVVLVEFTHLAVSNRRFEWTTPLWKPETLHLDEPAPQESLDLWIYLEEFFGKELGRLKRVPEGTVTRFGGSYSPLSQVEVERRIRTGEIVLGRPHTKLTTRPDERLARPEDSNATD